MTPGPQARATPQTPGPPSTMRVGPVGWVGGSVNSGLANPVNPPTA